MEIARVAWSRVKPDSSRSIFSSSRSVFIIILPILENGLRVFAPAFRRLNPVVTSPTKRGAILRVKPGFRGLGQGADMVNMAHGRCLPFPKAKDAKRILPPERLAEMLPCGLVPKLPRRVPVLLRPVRLDSPGGKLGANRLGMGFRLVRHSRLSFLDRHFLPDFFVGNFVKNVCGRGAAVWRMGR